MVIFLERGADLHMAQLMPLPLTVSCFSKIRIGFTFLVPAHPGSPGKRAVKRVCVCVFWYRPTRVVPEKGPLNGCVCGFSFLSQVIGWEGRFRSDLFCVEWDLKLHVSHYSFIRSIKTGWVWVQ